MTLFRDIPDWGHTGYCRLSALTLSTCCTEFMLRNPGCATSIHFAEKILKEIRKP